MARDQLEQAALSQPLSSESSPGAEAPEVAAVPGKVKPLLTALLQPKKKVFPVLRARWALRECDHVGLWPRLFGRARVRNGGRITIGERLLMYGGTVRCEIATQGGGVLEIGDRVFINYGVSISSHKLIKIGNRCQIGNYCMLMDNDYHQVGDKTMLGQSSPIIIEDDVWLGARVIVLKGVTIGQGAAIGAGSVVTRDIPPRSVAVGVPARVVKTF